MPLFPHFKSFEASFGLQWKPEFSAKQPQNLQLSFLTKLKFHLHIYSPPCFEIYKYNIKMSSFKCSENIQKKEVGSDRSVSDNQSSSVNLNELAMKARK